MAFFVLARLFLGFGLSFGLGGNLDLVARLNLIALDVVGLAQLFDGHAILLGNLVERLAALDFVIYDLGLFLLGFFLVFAFLALGVLCVIVGLLLLAVAALLASCGVVVLLVVLGRSGIVLLAVLGSSLLGVVNLVTAALGGCYFLLGLGLGSRLGLLFLVLFCATVEEELPERRDDESSTLISS